MCTFTRLVAVCAAFAFLSPLPTMGQEVAASFGQLRQKVEPGAHVYITDQSGRESRASIVEVGESTMDVTIGGQRRQLLASDVREIRRKVPDSLWNAALIGFGVGVALAVPPTLLSSPPVCFGGECIALAVGVGLGTGAIAAVFDAMLRDSEVIYRAAEGPPDLQVVLRPLVTKTTKGAAVTLRF